MQQARDEESNALMQLLSRQQMAISSGAASSSAPFDSMNSSNGAVGASQMNDFFSQSLMNNRGMNTLGGMDNVNAVNSALGSQLDNSMSSSFMNGGMNMNGIDSLRQMNQQVNMNNISSAAAAASSSGSSQFNAGDSRPFDLQMSNFMTSSFMNNQGNVNMDSLGMSLMSGGMSGMSGMNNAFMPGALNQQPTPKEDPGWEDQFKALRAYQLQFGNCKVPARFKCNPKLGRWVMTQRRQFTLLMQGFPSALTADRIRRLESIGFTWSVRPEPVTTWNKKFQELQAYKATYGNCMVPQRYQANPQLGTWVHTQRRQYKLMAEGKKSSMTREKADALDTIGFFWAAKNSTSSSSDKIISSGDVSDVGSHSVP